MKTPNPFLKTALPALMLAVALAFPAHGLGMALDRRVDRLVAGVLDLGDAEAKGAQRGTNESDVGVRVFELADLAVVGLITDQQRDALFCLCADRRRHQ